MGVIRFELTPTFPSLVAAFLGWRLILDTFPDSSHQIYKICDHEPFLGSQIPILDLSLDSSKCSLATFYGRAWLKLTQRGITFHSVYYIFTKKRIHIFLRFSKDRGIYYEALSISQP